MPKTLGTDKARQGRRGAPVLLILIAAFMLLAIAWFIAEMYGRATEPEGQTPIQAGQGVTE
jgi:hypothetical protein